MVVVTDHNVEYECSWIHLLGLEYQEMFTPVKEGLNECKTKNTHDGNNDDINVTRFEHERTKVEIHSDKKLQFYDLNHLSLIRRPLHTIHEELSYCEEGISSSDCSYLSNTSNTRKDMKKSYDDLLDLSIYPGDNSWNEQRNKLIENVECYTANYSSSNWGQFVIDDDDVMEESFPNGFICNYGLMKECSEKYYPQPNISSSTAA